MAEFAQLWPENIKAGPASKLLRAVEPWSSHLVLSIFALANAGVVWSTDVLVGRGQLIAALVLGLVAGKPVGIFLASLLTGLLGTLIL